MDERPEPKRRLRWGAAEKEAVAALGLGAVVVVLVGTLTPLSWVAAMLVGWDVVALTYTGRLALVLRRWDHTRTKNRAMSTDLDRLGADLALLGSAVVSLVAVGVLLTRGEPGTAADTLRIGLSLVSVAASWAMVHTIFAQRYAALYYGHPEGGIDFNEHERPAYRDFAYFAFTIGMSYAVSDTNVGSSEIRRAVLRHALLSYLFGTGILATTINLVASLSSG
jgi:uncharacterized membrane protein